MQMLGNLGQKETSVLYIFSSLSIERSRVTGGRGGGGVIFINALRLSVQTIKLISVLLKSI